MPTAAREIEKGEIFFFYRPRVGADEVKGREEVQRFYVVLAAQSPKKVYRLFLVGRKKLPQPKREQDRERRRWALSVLVSTKPDDIRRELAALEYTTKTRGKRFVPAAKPIGEGRYVLFRHGDHTELAYALELPKMPGPAQEEFEVKPEASYIVGVKNPEISRPGAPVPPKPPAYPRTLLEKFGRRRWIPVDDPALLDYDNTQLLLLGARAEEIETELGLHIDPEHHVVTGAAVCRELRMQCDRERVQALLTGDFPEREKSQGEAEGDLVVRARGRR